MTSKLRVQAHALHKGDIVGSGETVIAVQVGVRTPKGKVEVFLDKNGRTRMSYWGKYTYINITRSPNATEASANGN